MITHDLNVADLVLEDTVPMGEFFVVQPKGTDFDIIGKINLRHSVFVGGKPDIETEPNWSEWPEADMLSIP